MSTGARSLYGAYARRDWVHAETITGEYPGAHHELLILGLISNDPGHPGKPLVRNPKRALEHVLVTKLEEARQRVAFLSALPDLTKDLAGQYAASTDRPGRSSEYLDNQAAVNARIQDVVAGARTEILAAQPGGPRDKTILDIALSRDTAALDRGVSMRTIYRDTVRDHPVTAEYARIMATRTTGGAAQYRTLPGAFERLIIVDREQAFISDHIVGGPEHAAWHVTDRAVTAMLARLYDTTWMYAQPWTGELRARRGGTGVDSVSSATGVRTTQLDREILRCLSAGVSQPAIARRIGVSKRKLEEQIARLKGLWGVQTLNELVYQWALSPDHLVPDSAPDGACGDATGEETAA